MSPFDSYRPPGRDPTGEWVEAAVFWAVVTALVLVAGRFAS